MKTYWDYSEKERAALTSDQVRDLLKYELMEAGIVSPIEPVYEDETPIELPTKRYYKIDHGSYQSTHLVCETLEQAQRIIDARPQITGYDYNCGDKFVYSDHTEFKVEAVELYSKADVSAKRSDLQRLKSAKDANKKAKEKFNEDCRAAEKACEGIWDDWHECVGKDRAAKKLVGVYDDYVSTCDGDESVAMRFLRKAYTVDVIQAAFEWCGRSADCCVEVAVASET